VALGSDRCLRLPYIICSERESPAKKKKRQRAREEGTRERQKALEGFGDDQLKQRPASELKIGSKAVATLRERGATRDLEDGTGDGEQASRFTQWDLVEKGTRKRLGRKNFGYLDCPWDRKPKTAVLGGRGDIQPINPGNNKDFRPIASEIKLGKMP